MKIIDTHTHIGGKNIGFCMSESIFDCMIKHYPMEYYIVSNCDSAEFGHGQIALESEKQITQEDSLIRLIEFAKPRKEKVGIAVWVKPYNQTVTLQLRRLIEENRELIKAVKFHPYHSMISPVDERALPFLKLAAEYHLPVVSHTGGCEMASPKYVYQAAKMYPNINFVMVHMGLGTNNMEAIDLLGKADNLYGDTTWVKVHSVLEVIKRYGSKKILFGSDAPIDGVNTYRYNTKGDKSLYQEYFNNLPNLICEEDYYNLMYGNAKRIFLEK